ncbi:MAG: hypothetical protein M1305_05185 [Candidatus Marsarchaeota archaeon]|nr:hypothetical protein [Candidatus Marsarchaeota archaeon]
MENSQKIPENTRNRHSVFDVFAQFREAVREINKKYAKPRIQMTPMVKASLFMLRLYLLLLIGLLIYRFVTLVK